MGTCPHACKRIPPQTAAPLSPTIETLPLGLTHEPPPRPLTTTADTAPPPLPRRRSPPRPPTVDPLPLGLPHELPRRPLTTTEETAPRLLPRVSMLHHRGSQPAGVPARRPHQADSADTRTHRQADVRTCEGGGRSA